VSRQSDPREGGPLGRAIDSFSEEDILGLVAEAREDARERARTLLAEEIAERLLEQARRGTGRSGQPTPTRDRPPDTSAVEPSRMRDFGGAPSPVTQHPPPPVAPEPQAEGGGASDEGLGWYVYCIVGDGSLELDGIAAAIDDSHPLTVIAEGRLQAVASAVALAEFGELPLRERLDDLGWLEDSARAHEEVLDRVREQTTVVPMRLCTVYRSEDSVREMLAREAAVLEEALTRLTDKTEWGVKLYVDAEQLAAEAEEEAGEEHSRENPLAEARPGESYMLNKRREALRKEQLARVLDERCAEIHEELAATACESVLNRLQPPELSGHTGEMALNAAYLVEDSAVQEFAELVARLQERHRPSLEIELTGPWPPYNFVNSSAEVSR
jgi:hypothetical protein